MMITLQSFYFYNIGVAVPPFIAGIISTYFCTVLLLQGKFNKRSFLIGGVSNYWLFLLLSGIFLSIIYIDDVLIKRIIGFPLLIFVGYHFKYLLISRSFELGKSLKIVLYAHLIAFFAQLCLYYSGFGYLDYLMPITGETQRAFGGSYELAVLGGVELVRPTGLYNEPGSYSTYIFLLFLLYKSILFGKIEFANFKVLDLLVCLSIIFSFSIFGIIFVAIYFLFLIYSSKGYLFRKIVVLIAMSPFLIISINSYILPRFLRDSVDGNGLDLRNEMLNIFLSYADQNLLTYIFGIGIFTDPVTIIGPAVWNDSGGLFYLFVTTGVLGILLILYLFFSKLRSTTYILLFLVLFLSKVPPSSMFFWICWAGLMDVTVYRPLKIFNLPTIYYFNNSK